MKIRDVNRNVPVKETNAHNLIKCWSSLKLSLFFWSTILSEESLLKINYVKIKFYLLNLPIKCIHYLDFAFCNQDYFSFKYVKDL